MLQPLLRTLTLSLLYVAAFSSGAVELPQPKPSTAAANVQLLAQPFMLDSLNRSRQVRLYLPLDYASNSKRYPVLYMHDGQNVFDDATAFAGEWGVDETLNMLSNEGWLDLIVVAVDNGAEHRMTEYSGWDHPRFGVGEGEQYIRFVTSTVKPYIDQHYRTLSDAEHSGIMGSSMGGLISHYALFNQPGVFSKAGIFSPSYWYADAVFEQTDIKVLPANSRISMLVGDKEGPDMVSNMQKMAALIRQQGFAARHLSVKTVAGAEHNEAFWRSEFSDAVLFLYNPAGFYLRRR